MSMSIYDISLNSSSNKKMFQTKLKRKSYHKCYVPNISQDCSAICVDLLNTVRKDETFRSSIIAGNEARCLQYDPPTKRQIEEPRDKNSPASKKPLTLLSKTKTAMIAFFDCRCVVHKKFVPQGQTVNQDVYKGVQQSLRESIRRRFPELWAAGKCFLLHDNARPYMALSFTEFLSVHETTLHMRHILQICHINFFFYSHG